jgi:hypothetical protein
MPPSQPLFLHLAHVQNFNDDIYVTLLLVYLLLGAFLTSEQKQGREGGRSGGCVSLYVWEWRFIIGLNRPEMEITKNKNPYLRVWFFGK